MKANDIREKFIHFFVKHKRLAHHQVPSSSLIPFNDTSVLFTTAGMQQFKPYFLGHAQKAKKDFGNQRLTSYQKCFRVSDIEEVGDATHLTFFEMLGNFSVGDYFKNDAISLAWELISHKFHFPTERIWVTHFAGDEESKLPPDSETKEIWGKAGCLKDHIVACSMKDNFWGPPGKYGPCGPCTEIHYDVTQKSCEKGNLCKPNCSCGRFVEVWNIVFMEYEKKESGFALLKQKNIDTGMGLERMAAIIEKKESVFETSLFTPIISMVKSNPSIKIEPVDLQKRLRIICDHIRSTVFLLADDVHFGKKEQQAILRRIFRRALDQFETADTNITGIVEIIIDTYKKYYPDLEGKQRHILKEMHDEQQLYQLLRKKNVELFIRKLRKQDLESQTEPLQGPSHRYLSADEVFILFTTHGFSLEQLDREGYIFDKKELEQKIQAHKEKSRASAEKKFGGHGLDSVNESLVPEHEKISITKLHTATHLLHSALRKVLGNDVRQEGSDINPERLRFDFRFQKKLSDEELKKVETLVNDAIEKNMKVIREELPLQAALSRGAMAFFREKYPDNVSVYSVIDEKTGNIFSIELCGGPHVNFTGEIGNFKIQSEKSVAKGIRRIKATVAGGT